MISLLPVIYSSKKTDEAVGCLDSSRGGKLLHRITTSWESTFSFVVTFYYLLPFVFVSFGIIINTNCDILEFRILRKSLPVYEVKTRIRYVLWSIFSFSFSHSPKNDNC